MSTIPTSTINWSNPKLSEKEIDKWVETQLAAIKTTASKATNNVATILNAQDSEGQTPLHKAASAGNSKVIALLIAKGANAAIKDKKGQNVWHHAVNSGKAETVAELQNLESEFKGRVGGFLGKDNNGNNHLHLAVELNNIPMVKQICSRGPNAYMSLDKPNKQGDTLESLARNNPSIQAILMTAIIPKDVVTEVNGKPRMQASLMTATIPKDVVTEVNGKPRLQASLMTATIPKDVGAEVKGKPHNVISRMVSKVKRVFAKTNKVGAAK